MSEIVDFVYKLVRVRLEQGLPGRLLHCRVCKEPLTSTEGEFALKYFLIKKDKKQAAV